MHTKNQGNLTELQVLAAFVAEGFTVCIPYGDNSRYDFIAEQNGKMWRVQVKTSSSARQQGAYEFRCRSSHSVGGVNKNFTYTEKEIDYFATMIEGRCCVTKVGECSSIKTIRTIPPLNNQKIGITMIEDCELKNLIERGEFK